MHKFQQLFLADFYLKSKLSGYDTRVEAVCRTFFALRPRLGERALPRPLPARLAQLCPPPFSVAECFGVIWMETLEVVRLDDEDQAELYEELITWAKHQLFREMMRTHSL